MRTSILNFQIQQLQVSQQQIVQQQVVQPQQYAVVQENSMNNGTRQIYFVGSSNSTDIGIDESQNQQPIVLNHQIGQNNTIRARTPIQQLPVRATNAGGAVGVRQPLAQVIISIIVVCFLRH